MNSFYCLLNNPNNQKSDFGPGPAAKSAPCHRPVAAKYSKPRHQWFDRQLHFLWLFLFEEGILVNQFRDRLECFPVNVGRTEAAVFV